MNTWFVANDNGDIIGHDLSKAHAMVLALTMNDEEPDYRLQFRHLMQRMINKRSR